MVRLLAGAVHRDVTTVNTHWFITPIFNTTSVLRRTKEEKKNIKEKIKNKNESLKNN